MEALDPRGPPNLPQQSSGWPCLPSTHVTPHQAEAQMLRDESWHENDYHDDMVPISSQPNLTKIAWVKMWHPTHVCTHTHIHRQTQMNNQTKQKHRITHKHAHTHTYEDLHAHLNTQSRSHQASDGPMELPAVSCRSWIFGSWGTHQSSSKLRLCAPDMGSAVHQTSDPKKFINSHSIRLMHVGWLTQTHDINMNEHV